MTERDEKGRFKKKVGEVTTQPQYVAREGRTYTAPPLNTFWAVVIIFLLITAAFVFGMIANSEYNKSTFAIPNITTKQYDQSQILNTQKELIGQIINYEIKYGSGTVRWNVGINF